jgi:hypothetical protein
LEEVGKAVLFFYYFSPMLSKRVNKGGAIMPCVDHLSMCCAPRVVPGVACLNREGEKEVLVDFYENKQ